MKQLTSIRPIDKSYNTGEEPVLVVCNDHHSYVCKYQRYSGSANKLVCEVMGAVFAKAWTLNTPNIAMVKVLQQHVPHYMSSSFFSIPVLGSQLQHNVIDVTPTAICQIPSSEKLLRQLMHIALFDFWIANEDRNSNNSNLMYDYVQHNFIAIDFGCCFNTSTFDFPLSQLTETDSILCSALFERISQDVSDKRILQIAEGLTRTDFPSYINECQNVASVAERDERNYEESGTSFIPSAWHINKQRLIEKTNELLSKSWTNAVIDNFNETLNTALHHE